MISRLGKRLMASQLGYHGEGVPNSETIGALQVEYCKTLVADGVPAEIRSKLNRMQELATKALRGDENKLNEAEISKAFDEIVTIWSELIPILHFKVEEVDWDN